MSHSDEAPVPVPVAIPLDQLSQEALLGIVDAYVLGEATDYGHEDILFEKKRQQVLDQLQAGTARIVFDVQTETCLVVPVR
jgi:uncharacterized protein YheU (UPF0270 family)